MGLLWCAGFTAPSVSARAVAKLALLMCVDTVKDMNGGCGYARHPVYATHALLTKLCGYRRAANIVR